MGPSGSCRPVSPTACWFCERPVSFIYYSLTISSFPHSNKFVSCSGWKVRVFSEAWGAGGAGHRGAGTRGGDGFLKAVLEQPLAPRQGWHLV